MTYTQMLFALTFDKFFFGKNTNTSIISTDSADTLAFVEADWVNWEVPRLH